LKLIELNLKLFDNFPSGKGSGDALGNPANPMITEPQSPVRRTDSTGHVIEEEVVVGGARTSALQDVRAFSMGQAIEEEVVGGGARTSALQDVS
jgi:hypothetical protein